MSDPQQAADGVPAAAASPVRTPTGMRLLDRVRVEIRTRHYSFRTERAYVGWIRRFILFHGKRHPSELGATEVKLYLSSLAIAGRVSASTQNQAFSALLFLYRICSAEHILGYVAAAAMWRSGWNLLSVAGE